jgi:hypothetical protein
MMILLRISYRFTFLLLLLSYLLSSCKDDDECPTSFLNKSDSRLEVYNNYSESIVFQLSYAYPDTALDDTFDPISNLPENRCIQAGHSTDVVMNACWESIFSGRIDSDTLQVFAYSKDSVQLSKWDYIEENYLILDRKEFSLNDLQQSNWQVEFP